jgi:hypothetical protein
MMNDFDTRLTAFVTMVQDVMDANYRREGFTIPAPVVSVDPNGKKYVRITRQTNDSDKSVYCFVEKTTGNILKPAGWKGPAKHARGNIYTDDLGRSCCYPHSVAYL